jgi:nicotinate-nucleotide adenylyltransferase
VSSLPPGARPCLGVLGGSFDPPHLGHLVIASEACAALGLERVLFAPAAAPPHKVGRRRSSAAARLAMVALAVAGDPRFTVCAVEVERRLVFTRDTLAAIAALYPQHDLVFIMGSDSLLQFSTWHDARGILELCTLAVALRPGDDREAVAAAAALWGDRVRLVDAPLIGVSSTGLRDRVAAGLPLRYLVPATVEQYIREHGLYAS